MDRLNDDLRRRALEVLAAMAELPIDAIAKREHTAISRQHHAMLAAGGDLRDVADLGLHWLGAVALATGSELAEAAAAPREEPAVLRYCKAVVTAGGHLREGLGGLDGHRRREALRTARSTLAFVVRRLLGDAAPGPHSAAVLQGQRMVRAATDHRDGPVGQGRRQAVRVLSQEWCRCLGVPIARRPPLAGPQA